MKVARFFAVIFAVLGVLLMLATTVIGFVSIDSPVRILENPEGARVCSEELKAALDSGDYQAVAALLYGQPELGTQTAPDDVYSSLLWDAFREGMTLEYTGKGYLLDGELTQDGVLKVLDVEALTQSAAQRAQKLYQQTVAAAGEESDIYASDGAVRPEVVEQILQQALQQAIEQDASYVTHNVTLRLIKREGSWWVIPDQTFLKAISGPAA